MSLRLIKAVAETERLDDFHLARILILLLTADERKQTASTKTKAIEGITKLAKLDFLLRYPTCLERVLLSLGLSGEDVAVQARERTSIEAKMIRFRYGPWDARYRRWLGLLAARDLVALGTSGNTVIIGLTDAGRSLAKELSADPLFGEIRRRSKLVLKAVGSMSATKLKDFVYEVVPEIIDMKWGAEIDLGITFPEGQA